MRIFSKPINKPFVVSADKVEEFINHKNPESIRKIKEVAENFKKEMKIEDR